ncbi:5-azacytidine-induced protein 2 isoform X3 [Zootoca vivipara]|uniref:5-azacytidine-induced protein 2 isoform X3 n=1 Tax=Zootoca vivipara TaxID=8524 RepID=UPI00293BC13E|nr:5-azacytidine-induced protein 2 isoform X3 [Zootoca vivipara]
MSLLSAGNPSLAAAAMDELAEDDIYILNHEKADTHPKQDGEIPTPVYSGEESVASHFALVTAYEDIKKRLKETERENSLLKKRVRVLEEKMKENTESLKHLNEQLQSKEVELLQLRTEVETQQVMKSLNSTPSSWEIDKLNNALKVHSLEQDLEKLREECNDLRKELQKSIQKVVSQEGSLTNGECIQQQISIHSENVQQAYWELKREMSNLHLVTEVQAEMLRKLKLIPSATKKVPSRAPVQCIEDLERDTTDLYLAVSGAVYKKRLLPPSDHIFSNAVSSPSCTDERLIPVHDSPFQEPNSYGKSSLEDNSWVFPSPPKPSETVFWETKNRASHLNFPENSLDHCNQNCLHKS